MGVPIGLNIFSGLVSRTTPYLDAVAAPFDSIWYPDHVQYGNKPVGEGWTLMVYGLARHPDKLCGHQVLCNSFRNPAHLAKMAATAQALSGGRFILGIGAGWNEEEYHAYGWPFPSARIRIEQMVEAIRICRALWQGGPVDFQGKHYTVMGAHCEPLPDPLPPVMIGGSGEKYLLAAVAQHADWWNYIYQTPEAYRHKQNILQEHCRAAQRDYAEIVQVIASQILIAPSAQELARLQTDPQVRPVSANGIAGTPEQVTEQLQAAVDRGAGRIHVSFADSPRVDGTQLFIEEVLPHFT